MEYEGTAYYGCENDWKYLAGLIGVEAIEMRKSRVV
jgi:hypothetical protein